MITVNILINGQPIFTRSAVRVVTRPTYNKYELDTGETIIHRYEDGAVVLAKKMLETIKEPRRTTTAT